MEQPNTKECWICPVGSATRRRRRLGSVGMRCLEGVVGIEATHDYHVRAEENTVAPATAKARQGRRQGLASGTSWLGTTRKYIGLTGFHKSINIVTHLVNACCGHCQVLHIHLGCLVIVWYTVTCISHWLQLVMWIDLHMLFKRLQSLPPTSWTRGLDACFCVWCHLGSIGVARAPKWAICHSCAGGSTDSRRFAGFWARNSGGLRHSFGSMIRW